MATYIETHDTKIMIDPGVNLAKKRYGLPPHPIELEKKEEHWKEIVRYAQKADVIIITHYHYDHYNPVDNLEIFDDKYLFIKNPIQKINESQKGRAKVFLEEIKKRPIEIIYADGREFFIGETRILFSNPVFHGADPKLGYVIQVLIDDFEKKFLFTSDVQGIVNNEQKEFILENKPDIIFLDGPVTYLPSDRATPNIIRNSLENITALLKQEFIKTMILDHHLLRDINWKILLQRHIIASLTEKIRTAAEFCGKPITLLEANRNRLWAEEKT